MGLVQNILAKYNVRGDVRLVRDEVNPYDGKITKDINADRALYMSELGTPVIADVTFQGGTYTDNNGAAQTFNDIRLECVLMNVSQAKRIVKTEIDGSDGTVKEYIGLDDYQVVINGILTAPNGQHPTQKIADLSDMLKAPIGLSVVSRYLQNLGIFQLVVESWAMDQEPGGYSKQGFTINAISDKPVELLIIQNVR